MCICERWQQQKKEPFGWFSSAPSCGCVCMRVVWVRSSIEGTFLTFGLFLCSGNSMGMELQCVVSLRIINSFSTNHLPVNSKQSNICSNLQYQVFWIHVLNGLDSNRCFHYSVCLHFVKCEQTTNCICLCQCSNVVCLVRSHSFDRKVKPLTWSFCCSFTIQFS